MQTQNLDKHHAGELVAARENLKIVALMNETAKIAGSSKPIPYELRQSVAAATE